jgi:hypothetical protein
MVRPAELTEHQLEHNESTKRGKFAPNADGTYEVDRIVDVRGRGWATEYRVRWSGVYRYENYDSWFNHRDLPYCGNAIEDFRKANKQLDNETRAKIKRKNGQYLSMKERMSRIEPKPETSSKASEHSQQNVTNSRRRQHTKQLGCRDPVPKWAKSNK